MDLDGPFVAFGLFSDEWRRNKEHHKGNYSFGFCEHDGKGSKMIDRLLDST